MATLAEKVKKHKHYSPTWRGTAVPLRDLIYHSRVPGISRKGQPIGGYADEVRDRTTLLKRVLYDIHPGSDLPRQIAGFINTGLRASFRFTTDDPTNFDDRLAYVVSLTNDYREAWLGSWQYDRNLSLRDWKKRILVHLDRINPEGRRSHNLKQLFAALNMALSWLHVYHLFVKPIEAPIAVGGVSFADIETKAAWETSRPKFGAGEAKTDRLAETLRRDLEIKVAEKLGVRPETPPSVPERNKQCEGWCFPKKTAVVWTTRKLPVTNRYSQYFKAYCEECFDKAGEREKGLVWDWLFNHDKFADTVKTLNDRLYAAERAERLERSTKVVSSQIAAQSVPLSKVIATRYAEGRGQTQCDYAKCPYAAVTDISRVLPEQGGRVHNYSCSLHMLSFMERGAQITVNPL